MLNHPGLPGLAILGLLLGMNHATDPDHVIAVTTILSRERRMITAARIGVIWGLGHTATVLAVGAAIILLKITIPARVGLAMEMAVAIVLILLGLSSVRDLVRSLLRKIVDDGGEPAQVVVHSHRHSHGGLAHNHPHAHEYAYEGLAETAHDHLFMTPAATVSRRPLLRSFSVGLVHGMAGSAAIALLALGAIPYPTWAVVYLTIFCVGTIIGMLLITTALGAPFVFAAARMNKLHHGLQTGAGLLSFVFGVVVAWQIGIIDHLFGVVPHWTPH